MNITAKPLRERLRQRGLNFERLCSLACVHPTHFSAVLAGKHKGRHVWRRIRGFLHEDEQNLVVELFGDVFTKQKPTKHQPTPQIV